MNTSCTTCVALLALLLAACGGPDARIDDGEALVDVLVDEPGRIVLGATGHEVELSVSEEFARYRVLNADGVSVAAGAFGSVAEPWGCFAERGGGDAYVVWLRGSVTTIRIAVSAGGVARASLDPGDPRLQEMPAALASAF